MAGQPVDYGAHHQDGAGARLRAVLATIKGKMMIALEVLDETGMGLTDDLVEVPTVPRIGEEVAVLGKSQRVTRVIWHLDDTNLMKVSVYVGP